ncbi:/ / hypothetical protein / 407932:409428 Reverse [Candidatus Hepatoplasma crinochetorum]|uniref:Uncharacterized protein n=1 Tax=Candidatus Hepatoplasma crinochetorum TaxID=295596 RepID=A0A0G7ZN40_9MOLU|nr:/ / hypothetical protein / 407932:409428 Reverse [Candidatus Hepatoplasma crinochetorum]
MKFKELTLKIKYFFSSSWGHIFISVIITVAILLLIFLPIVLAGSGKKQSIFVYGFDANITGTGEKFNSYIGVDDDYDSWNHDLVWAQNEEQMLTGVEQSKNSIGYIGKSVSSFAIYDEDTNPDGELKTLELWVDDTDIDNSIPNEGEYVDYTSDLYPIFSTLNIWFRVPDYVAPIINKNIMFSNTTGIDIDQTIWGTDWVIGSEARTLTEEQDEYFQDYVISPNYLKYFVFSFIFFNWVAFSEQAQLIIDGIARSYQPDDFNQDYLLSDQEFEQYLANFANNLESINADWTIDNFVNNNSDNGEDVTLILTLEGTGTNQPTLDALTNGNDSYDGFSDYLTIWLQDYYNNQDYSFDFTLALNNYGSGQAFAIKSNNASPNAFLGSQSRGYDIDDITRTEQVNSNNSLTWGYDTITEADLDSEGLYYLPDTETDQNLTQPIYYTFAIDPIIIITGKNTSFETNGNTYHPKGITPEGLRYAYSFDGESWEELYVYNLIETEEDTF